MTIRRFEPTDVDELARLRIANRAFLEPFEPPRPESFFTPAGQADWLASGDGLRLPVPGGGGADRGGGGAAARDRRRRRRDRRSDLALAHRAGPAAERDGRLLGRPGAERPRARRPRGRRGGRARVRRARAAPARGGDAARQRRVAARPPAERV